MHQMYKLSFFKHHFSSEIGPTNSDLPPNLAAHSCTTGAALRPPPPRPPPPPRRRISRTPTGWPSASWTTGATLRTCLGGRPRASRSRFGRLSPWNGLKTTTKNKEEISDENINIFWKSVFEIFFSYYFWLCLSFAVRKKSVKRFENMPLASDGKAQKKQGTIKKYTMYEEKL